MHITKSTYFDNFKSYQFAKGYSNRHFKSGLVKATTIVLLGCATLSLTGAGKLGQSEVYGATVPYLKNTLPVSTSWGYDEPLVAEAYSASAYLKARGTVPAPVPARVAIKSEVLDMDYNIKSPTGLSQQDFEAITLGECKGSARFYAEAESRGYSGLFFYALEALESNYKEQPAGRFNTLSWTTDAITYYDFKSEDAMWDYTFKRFDEYFCLGGKTSLSTVNAKYSFHSTGVCPTCVTGLNNGSIVKTSLPADDGCINWDWSAVILDIMATAQSKIGE